MATNDFKESCGTIVESIRADDKSEYLCRAYYPLYMFRRFAFAMIIVVLKAYPYIQLFAITSATLLPVLSLQKYHSLYM
jgi:hypothetical protein